MRERNSAMNLDDFTRKGAAAQAAVNKVLDLCMAGESAINGVCGDPECVCAPDSLKLLPRCEHGHPIGTSQGTQYGCELCPVGNCNRLFKPRNVRYVAKHGNVMQGAQNVAVAKSHTFAKRIAKALNLLRESETQTQQTIGENTK
jgi:hypothetical protein